MIYGIMIKLMPQLFGSSDSSGGSNEDGAGTVFYTFLLIFSQAFSAASNVCKSGAKQYQTLSAKTTRNSRRIDALAPPRARGADKETALKGANIDEWYDTLLLLYLCSARSNPPPPPSPNAVSRMVVYNTGT